MLAKVVRLQLFVGRFALSRGGPELRMQLGGILRGRHPIRRKARPVVGRRPLIRAKTQAKFLATGDWHCLARPRTMRRKSRLHALTRPPVRVRPPARRLPGRRRMDTLSVLTAARRITRICPVPGPEHGFLRLSGIRKPRRICGLGGRQGRHAQGDQGRQAQQQPPGKRPRKQAKPPSNWRPGDSGPMRALNREKQQILNACS